MTAFRKCFAALILTHFLVAVFAGCGAERETETADESAAAEAAARSAAIAEAGAEIPPPGQLPSDFPADLPTYPGAVVQQSASIPIHGIFVGLVTTASSEEVYEYYREQLQNRGWNVSEPGDGKHRLTASKEGRTASIIAVASGAQTEIGISIEEN